MKLASKVVLLSALLTVHAFATSMTATVPSDGTVVSIPLVPGWYDVYASGTYGYDYADRGYAIADAEWMQSTDYIWYEYPPLDPTQRICDLTVDGTFLDWSGLKPDGQYYIHTYSASHEYKVQLLLGDIVDFQIYDPLYWYDNSGSLKVRIEPIPEPSSMLLFGGGLIILLVRRRKRE